MPWPVLARHALLAALLGLSVTAPALADAPSALEDNERKPAKDCVESKTEAAYRGYGYNHLVHLHNGCEKRMTCKVSTNVNPQQTEVTLAPGEDQTVTTFSGSPAREFTAKVECSEAK